MKRAEFVTAGASRVPARNVRVHDRRPALARGCLHELFEASADRFPDAPALICGDDSLTYRELEQKSNQLAHYLRLCGAGPGKLVGLYFERSARPIIAILACLKAGAAYLPIDPAYPAERIRQIVAEAEIVLLLTESALSTRAAELFSGAFVDIDARAGELRRQPAARLLREDTGVAPEDLCYVIYTSGTTGRPKGVMTEHRNAFAYVVAFNEVCATTPADRVFQGFLLSFDGSVEEIWMAFSNGSALVVGSRRTPRVGNELGQFLARHGVTYFSTVPTVLSTITEPVRPLRLLVLSGEVCPPELVNRWARPGLRVLNVYGPTEATVNTTVADCVAGQPITIGRPLRGYHLHLLDERMRPVVPGQTGELYIGGETLARGYLKQPEMTASHFVTVRPASEARATRLYRTGDLVRRRPGGELEFLGRKDGQIKIRGHRVELSEIETVLLENEAIRSASVKLVERAGFQCLAAYVVLARPSGACSPLDRTALLARLGARLPPYMIPRFLEVVPELPTLASGKVDRARLPVPVSPLTRAGKPHRDPESELEIKIAALWARLFGVPHVSTDDDFFVDLGGHSLLAAQMVTCLREEIGKTAGLRDAYGFPTVRGLAAHLAPQADRPRADRHSGWPPAPTSRAMFESLSPWARRGTPALQALATYLLHALTMIPVAALALLALAWLRGSVTTSLAIGIVLGLSLIAWPLRLALSIAAKWLIIGRYRPGRYPLWGFYYFRFWLAGRFQSLSGAGSLTGTPLMPLYFRWMGARVGHRCTLDTGLVAAWDLIAIGDDTSIGADTQILGYRVENGMLILGRADIGNRCFIGIHSALGLSVKMGDDARLDDQSLLPDGQSIGQGEAFRGSPAKPDSVRVPEGPPRQVSRLRRGLFGLAHLVLGDLLSVALLVPRLLQLALLTVAFVHGGVGLSLAALVLLVPVGVVFQCLFIAALKHLILSRATPGIYPVDSAFYLRKWLADSLMRQSRGALLPLYTTLYLPPWLRLLGAEIGPRAELSTVWYFAPELVRIEAESFLADGSIIGGKRFFRGRFEIGINHVGRRSFVGNGAVLPMGKGLGDRCLLGVQSIPPADPAITEAGTEWLGSPAFALPNRPRFGGFDDAVTFCPKARLYLQRALIDGLRILIPAYLGLAAFAFGVAALALSFSRLGLAEAFALAPLIGLAIGLASMLAVVALKKLVMGTFEPVVKPLWSPYIWLNEMVNGAYESVMAPALAPFLGTPFIAPMLRWMGCKIGRHGYIATTLFSEFDLVEIGDHAALNLGAVIQNHLFEDRIMKSSRVKIGDECSVGNMAVVLYDSEMKRGASVGPLSLLMKGETLAAFGRWHGIPAVQAPEQEEQAAPSRPGD